MAQKSSYTDVVHHLVRDSAEPLTINEIVDRLNESESENPPKNARATVRSALRTSGLIKAVGKSQFDWIPRILRGVRMRHTLQVTELAEQKLDWDTDLLIAQWPAVEEAETRRERDDVTWKLEGGPSVALALIDQDDHYSSTPDASFWAWLKDLGAEPGDDLIVTATDPINHQYEAVFQKRSERNEKLIEERNRVIKRRTGDYLQTQRDNLAKPREIVAALIANKSYHDSVPPQTVSNNLPGPVLEKYGSAVPSDDFQVNKESNVIPFPNKSGEDSVEPVARIEEADPHTSSVALDIPFNTGKELPDERAYLDGLQMLESKGEITPGLAIHVLNTSRLCSPAYALLSQTSEYKKEALDLAGQSVVAAERRIAHGLVESLITGEEFAIEEAIADYLESRSFLARALWHGSNFDDAIEQALHCFEVDPEDPSVREDLFVMLFDTDRCEVVLRLLESFPGASVTEDLYHRALAALIEEPDSREAKKALRKAVGHNLYLASRFLGEEPKKAKRSSVEEATAYESAYGFLWRREDAIFDLLEEIVLAKR